MRRTLQSREASGYGPGLQPVIKVWLFRLAGKLVPLIPRRFGCLVAGGIGGLAYYLTPGARGVVESNMEMVLGEGASPAKVRQLAKGVFANAAKNYFELFGLPKLEMAEYHKVVRFLGYEHLAKARAEGRGTVIVSAHLGNFDVCAQEIAALSLDMVILVEPVQPPELFDLVTGLRASKGVKWVPVGPSALKETVRALRQGAAVGVAGDRDIQKSGLRMPFFGRVTGMPQGAAYLALRTGALVVPAFSERLADDSYLIHCEPVLEIERTGDFDHDLRKAMAQIIEVLERHIGTRPDQWVVFERIWPDEEEESGQGR